jgi:hypothetical protein
MAILQDLLNVGLVEIGSEDSRFERIQAAASALATRFKAEPRLLVPATLVCLDDDIDEDDPMFVLVEELVIAQWKTLRNTHVNRPRQLLRSVIIDALATTIDSNAMAAGVAWYTAASPLRHRQVRLGKAHEVVERLLKNASHIAEAEAVVRAGLSAPTAREDNIQEATEDKVSLNINSTIKDDEIIVGVARAAGPQYAPKPNLENPNPHWPQQAPQWVNEFVPRMTAALVNAVNLGTSRLAQSLSENLAGPLSVFEKKLAIGLSELGQLRDETLQSYQASRMRLDVLWWSEALYSPSLQVGYRDLPLSVASVAAAVDLVTIVPALAPASVCHILGETVHRLARILNGDGALPIITYLHALADAKTNFGDGLPNSTTNEVRSPLLGLVGEASTGSRIPAEVLRLRAGVDGALQLSPAEFATWVFRDLQARRLVEGLE